MVSSCGEHAVYEFDFYRSHYLPETDGIDQLEPYVVIGEFDYLKFRHHPASASADPLPSPTGDCSRSPIPDVVELVVLLGSESLTTPLNISDWLNHKKEAGLLVRIDLQDTEQDAKPFQTQKRLAEIVYQALANKAIPCICFGSISLYSVYALIDLSECGFNKALNTVFHLCQETEAFSLTLRTTTVPFGKPKAFHTPRENHAVDALIRINTNFRNQGLLRERIRETWKIEPSTLTGDDDLFARIDNIDLQDLFLRINETQKQHAITRTSICSRFAFAAMPSPLSSPSEPSISLDHISDSGYRRMLCLLHHHIGTQPADFHPSFIKRLYATLAFITHDVEGKGNEFKQKQTTALLDVLREALIQRKAKRSDISLDVDLSHSNLSLGAFFPLLALDLLAQSYYKNILHSFPEKIREQFPEWKGIVLASDRHGFAALPYGIILVPYAALLDPLSPFGYWNTLSHEIAHLFAAHIVKSRLEPLIQERASQYSNFLARPEKPIRRQMEIDTNEITAHWIDFRYPFNGDIDRYATSIWSTWQPLLEKKQDPLLDYHIRTFSIFICDRNHALFEHLQNNNNENLYSDSLDIFEQPFDDYLQALPRWGIAERYINPLHPDHKQAHAKELVISAVARLAPILRELRSLVPTTANPENFALHKLLFDRRTSGISNLHTRINALLEVVSSFESSIEK